jgi:hypothetical protein
MPRKFAATTALMTLAAAVALGQDASTPGADNWKFEAYPVLIWAPVFGADVTLPTFPDLPNVPDKPGVESPSGSVSGSFNGAAFAGFRMEYKRFSAETEFLWAGLSGTRETPLTTISVDMIAGRAMGGWRVSKSFWAEGGVRRIALDISARLGTFPEVSRKPGLWDPLVGFSYRRPLGKSWTFKLLADGGGFGVGSDVDITSRAEAQWRFGHGHFGATMGYGVFRLIVNNEENHRNLKLDQTLHGPVLGFGIYF